MVGSHLLLELVLAGEKVRALKRPKSNIGQVRKTFSWYRDDAEDLFGKIEWVEGDVLDIFSLDEAVKGVSEIYHCAGMVSFYKKDRFELQRINHFGTANIVNAALKGGIRKLCHVSSVSALGKEKQGETITENHLWKTSKHNSYYAISKYAAEREVWRGMEEGLDSIIVIPSDHRKCPARFVVIGAHDESVSPGENISFFRNAERVNCHQRVLVCEWLAHQIDYDTFDEMVCWARKSYRLHNGNSIN